MRFIVSLVAAAMALCFGSGSLHAAEAIACGSGAVATSFTPSRQSCPLSAAEERALKPKDVFKECDKGCPEMMVVPAGAFTMGSPADEVGRQSHEDPQHQVTIAHAFAVGRFAVTFDEWDACVSDGGCGEYRPYDQRWGRGRRPVINVSWDDAKTYLQWLSKKTGHEYRLLSEAEREYVTRAGTTTPFWWGATITTDQANYCGMESYNGGAKGECRRKTLPVGSFTANPFGLFDVHGNVWEWVEDCYGSYKESPTDGSARNIGDCATRLLRGGSWIDEPKDLRAATRLETVIVRAWYSSGGRGPWKGFRVGRTLSP